MRRYWAVVPAAGVGRRMGATTPKQYLALAGRPVIEHTLARLLANPDIGGVYVALSPDDGWWESCYFAGHPAVRRVTGGQERCDSVLNALNELAAEAASDDWVLVHDAARPCLSSNDLATLIERLHDEPVGGILAAPIHDTVKRCNDQTLIEKTLPRDDLWRALTPQMFRLGLLRESLEAALVQGLIITDEASAMELAGYSPRLIEGSASNIKITQPEDLELAAFYLAQAGKS